MIGTLIVKNVERVVKLLVVLILQKTTSALSMISDPFYVIPEKCLMKYTVRR